MAKQKMKATRAFYGREGMLRKGVAFDVDSKQRGEDLERRGLASFASESDNREEEEVKEKKQHQNKATGPGEDKGNKTSAEEPEAKPKVGVSGAENLTKPKRGGQRSSARKR